MIHFDCSGWGWTRSNFWCSQNRVILVAHTTAAERERAKAAIIFCFEALLCRPIQLIISANAAGLNLLIIIPLSWHTEYWNRKLLFFCESFFHHTNTDQIENENSLTCKAFGHMHFSGDFISISVSALTTIWSLTVSSVVSGHSPALASPPYLPYWANSMEMVVPRGHPNCTYSWSQPAFWYVRRVPARRAAKGKKEQKLCVLLICRTRGKGE